MFEQQRPENHRKALLDKLQNILKKLLRVNS